MIDQPLSESEIDLPSDEELFDEALDREPQKPTWCTCGNLGCAQVCV